MPEPARHMFCESSADLEGLLSKAVAGVTDTVWSANRGVSLAPGIDRAWRSPENLIEARHLETLWRRIVDQIEPAIRVTQAIERENPAFFPLSAVLPVQIIALFRSIGTKAMVLEAWRDHVGDAGIVCGDASLSDVAGLSAMVGRIDNVTAALAEALNDGDGVPIRRWRDGAKAAVDAERLAPEPVARDRIFNILNRTGSALAYQLWRRVGLCPAGLGSRTVAIVAPNEMIEESFLPLVFSRNRVVSLRLPTLDGQAGEPLPAGAAEELERLWSTASAPVLSHDFTVAAWQVMAPRLTAVAARVPGASRRMNAWIDGHAALSGRRARRVAVLSNGLYAAPERIFDALVRRRGIPVVCTDHGIGVGIGARHARNARLVTCFSDLYLTHNSKTAAVYSNCRHRPSQRYQPVGSPVVTRRARFRSLQRRVYRRAFGVRGGERLLIYVANLSANNMHQGWGTSTDTEFQSFQAKLIQRLGSFPGRVAVKPYPAHRYADPEPVWYAQAADRVALAPAGEFRQQRWAADLLVLDLGSSTLGWAMGTDKPIVYVDNASNPLDADARNLLADSMFFVDALTEGWQEVLEDVLSMPAPEMRRQWQKMKDTRERFAHEFGLGADGPVGPRIARAVGETLSQPPAAAVQDIGVHQ